MAAVSACGGNGDDDGFVADNPFGPGGGGLEDGGTAAGDGGEDGGDSGGDEGDREISEADIVMVEGNRLYALSPYGGLAVIDISTTDSLPVLGRHRAHATPFEMYVDGGQVFVMYSDFGRYVVDETDGLYQWRSTSRLVALDATDPGDIFVRGEFELPGAIQDSRRVGDVLYLVTNEDGYCWGCKDKPNTTVTSLDISDTADVAIVDQLSFETGGNDPWDWSGQRSVSSTDERMYVAGIEYTDFDAGHSVIEVIDISDPGGALLRGASVDVAGQIQSRWQMDEHEGILRVVSQPFAWASSDPPRVETFTVTAADDVAPLGSLAMTLPRPETLQSVRFDGPRGYAITFEQTDPLFTLDLSDPATPLQVGELEIPGWVFHMEPRGDRILGLGFDRDAPEGALNVSLFDVSDFANPTMLSRVHFGGDWADFAEDQNRIHKAFQVSDELGLLLVPFSGWRWDDEFGCHGRNESGIQLIDWVDDALDLRGVAESEGQARRAILLEKRMLGVSDMNVESFDISDRDAPRKTAGVALASNVSRVAVRDGLVVRLSQDWWSDSTLLEVAAAADPGNPQPLGRVDLSALVGGDATGCWDYGYYGAEIFLHAGHAYLLRTQYGTDEQWYGEGKTRALLDVVDVRDAAAPQYLRTVELGELSSEYGGYHAGAAGVQFDERRAMQVGNALVLAAQELDYDGDLSTSRGEFVVIDLSDPANPEVGTTVERPVGVAHGSLQSFGDELVSWHARPVHGDHSKIRFYFDRLDVSNPSNASVAQSVNVPGIVAGYNDAAHRLITVDFQLEAANVSNEECWNHPRVHTWDEETGRCFLGRREIHLVRLDGDSAAMIDSVDAEGEDGRMLGLASTDQRLFAYVQRGQYEWGEFGPTQLPRGEVSIYTGVDADALDNASTLSVAAQGYFYGAFRSEGNRVVFAADTGLAEIDASDAAAPFLQMHPIWGYGCNDLQLVDGTAYCAMGPYGLQAVAL